MTEIAKTTITLLFADMEGSTRLIDEIGDEFASVLAAYRRMLEQAIAQGGGRTVNTEGDGHFACFPTAAGGVTAAVAAQRLFAGESWPGGREVRARMGVHVGEVWQTLDDFAGPEVHRAARIANAAHGGQILVSQPVLDAVGPDLPAGVEVRDLGAHMLKDLARPERIHELAIAGLRTDFPPIRTLETGAHNLKAQLTSFVGREDEMAALRGILKASRLVTVTGPGGVGKTRLATQVAAVDMGRHPDGVWLVELAPTTDPDLVAAEVARTLQVPQEAVSPVAETVLRYIAGKQIMLIMDNCEHVIEGAGDFIEAALRSCPNLRVLATSRESLGVAGEAHYPLAPLPRPRATTRDGLAESAAVRLFVERAALVQPHFDLDRENAAAVAEICTRLEGIPLALELAAARVRVLSARQIADRLDDQLRLLSGRERGRPDRHRTLTAAMEWSHDLLSDHERMLLRRISVFRGGFTLAAAEGVCPDDACPRQEILDLLMRLIDTSLVVPGTGAEPRHRLLETVRQYAWERLIEADEADSMRGRHAEHFADAVAGGGTGLSPLDLTEWLARLEPDLDNFNAALGWTLEAGHHELALRLAGGLARLFYRHGYYAEMRRWFDAVLAHDGHPPGRDLARVLRFATGLAMDAGELEKAKTLAERELAVAREVDDPGVLARSLNLRAGLAWRAARFDDAADAYAEAHVIARERAPSFVSNLLVNYAELSTEVGNLDRARRLVLDLERWGRDHGEDLPDLHRARAHLAYAAGDLESAESDYRVAIDEYRRHGLRGALAKALQGIGLVMAYAGALPDARAAVEESLTLYREMNDLANEGESLCALATVAIAEGDAAAAAHNLHAALERYRRARRDEGVADVATLAVAVAMAAQRDELAVTLLGAAEEVDRRLGRRHPRPLQDATEHRRTRLSGRMSQEAFASAARAGAAAGDGGLAVLVVAALG